MMRDGASIGVVTDASVISALAHDTHHGSGADSPKSERRRDGEVTRS